MPFAMANDPFPNITAADVRANFAGKLTEKDLADAFALTSNKFFWEEDNEYDFEEGTPEYQAACAVTDEWGALMDEYQEKIWILLRKQGIPIPETGQIAVLTPFMEKYGYQNDGGWWIRE